VRSTDPAEQAQLPIATTAVVKSKGSYSGNVGDYPIQIGVNAVSPYAGNPIANITGKVINGNTAPVLIVPNAKVVKKGDLFPPGSRYDTTPSYMQGVYAVDADPQDQNLSVLYSAIVEPGAEGIYRVPYWTTDSGQNYVTKDGLVFVGSWILGDDYAITAEDFSKTLSEVSGSDAELKKFANVKVIDIRRDIPNNNGDGIRPNPNYGRPVENSAMAIVLNNGGYRKEVGEYNVTFAVKGDNDANVTIRAKVGSGDMPVLVVPEYKKIDLGDAFDEEQYMRGVSATDTEDDAKGVKLAIVHDSPVNSKVEGYYSVSYSVTDSDGNTARATGLVFVGQWHVTSTYAINAYNFSKRVGQVRGTDSEMINSARAVAVDVRQKLADGTANPNYGKQTPVSVLDDGGYGGRKAGSFPIKFAVQADLSVTKTITATVTSGTAPILTVPATRTVPLGAGFNYMTGVTATDAEDGNLTYKIVHDTPVNTSSVGSYRVTYSVTDSDGNTVTKHSVVLVGTGWVVRDGYALYAEDFARKLSEITGTRSEAVRLAKAIAVWIADSSSGDFGKYMDVTITDRGGYKKAAGNYDITFAISEQRSVTKTIRASISDDSPKAPIVNTPPPVVNNNTTNTTNTTSTTTIPAPAPTPAPAPVTPPVVEMQPTPVPETAPEITEPPVVIAPDEPPLAAPEGAWHLIDLLLTILAIAFGFYLMAYALRRRDEDEDQDTARARQIRMWGQLGILLAIVSTIVLLLTQDFTATMKMADAWTVLFGLIFGIEFLAVLGLTSAKEKEWDEQRDI
jgi:hypothetical protein